MTNSKAKKPLPKEILKAIDATKRAEELLSKQPKGDDHFPGDHVLERQEVKKVLPFKKRSQV